MSGHRVLLVIGSALWIATSGWAGSEPVTVSPGSAAGALIEPLMCPTSADGKHCLTHQARRG